MIKRTFDDKKTKVLSMHGMGMRSYYQITRMMLKLQSIPKVVFLPLLPESFMKTRHLLPRAQHAPLLQELSKKINFVDTEFEEYLFEVNERVSKIITDPIGFKKSGNTTNAKYIFKMNYMDKISETTEDSIYVFKFIKLCEENKIKLIPYIPPVNYQYANNLLSNFNDKYQINQKIMTSWTEKNEFQIMDLSYIFESEYFGTTETIDETCNYKGRKILVKMFNEKLSEVI